MTTLNKQKVQAIERNFSLVVDFLDRKLRRTNVHLSEVPCYFYKGNESKLEIRVFSDPRIGKIDLRILNLRNYDREPSLQCNYDLDELSIAMFQKRVDDLISEIK